MIEKTKILPGSKQFCAAILADPSKAFSSIPYDLHLAKLNANGFNQEALKLIHSYLCDRSQKVASSFSKELDILCHVPQGSILGPLLSNIEICDLFFLSISVLILQTMRVIPLLANVPHTTIN